LTPLRQPSLSIAKDGPFQQLEYQTDTEDANEHDRLISETEVGILIYPEVGEVW
jgi:hypothetical protein